MKKSVNKDLKLIAACGLYCGNCGKFRKGRCPGCISNSRAAWCKIRNCCLEKGIENCSCCKEFSNQKECNKYNNFVARVFEFVFFTDRTLCIEKLRSEGAEKFVEMMEENGWISMPKSKNL
jgi:hypothetical protein